MSHTNFRERRKRWSRRRRGGGSERGRRRGYGEIKRRRRRKRPMKKADNSRISRVSLINCRPEVCKHWLALRNSFTGFGLKKKEKTTVCSVEKEKKKKQTNSGTFSDADVLSAETADWLLSICLLYWWEINLMCCIIWRRQPVRNYNTPSPTFFKGGLTWILLEWCVYVLVGSSDPVFTWY